jgi:transposase
MSRIADGLGVSWNTANQAVLDEGRRVLISDPARFDNVAVIGVDEHCWRHTGRGDKYVTVIVDLTPVRDQRGPARLLDMIEGRSKKVFADWLAGRPHWWRGRVQIVAMDGFAGFKSAAAEQLPDAVEVMDPFHVVQLAGDALDACRQRVQQETAGHRGRAGDPLFAARLTLHTGCELLTNRQLRRMDALFTGDQHVQVEATWGVYQQIMAAYRHPDPAAGRRILATVIDTLATGVPAGLDELRRLGNTMKRRAGDILAWFDHPHTSNGPTEAINGRLEHLRGIALGFRNITNYITRSLLDTGGFKPALHPQL